MILSILLNEVTMSVRHALLALLSEGPKYGLQLRQEFEARTGDVWISSGDQDRAVVRYSSGETA